MAKELTESVELPDPGLEPAGEVDRSGPSDEGQHDVIEVEERPWSGEERAQSTREAQEHLRTIGWPVAVDGVAGQRTARAVRHFQGGWAFYELAVDGQAGPQTQRALTECVHNGGKCAAYFAFREFRCRCSAGEGCGGWIMVSRVHAFRLDRYRERVGGSVALVSGHRCTFRNPRAGGAPNSRHLYGDASDVPGALSRDEVRSMGLFTGIGYSRASGRVLHVDSRPGNPSSPTVWAYA